MKQSALWVGVVLLAISIVFSTAVGQEKKKEGASGEIALKGYLVDQMCANGMVKRGGEQAMERAARHTRTCALEEGCRASGYGLMSGGKFYKFDAKGDTLALDYFEKTSIERGHLVEVKGRTNGTTFTVTSLAEVGNDQKGKGGLKEAKPKR